MTADLHLRLEGASAAQLGAFAKANGLSLNAAAKMLLTRAIASIPALKLMPQAGEMTAHPAKRGEFQAAA